MHILRDCWRFQDPAEGEAVVFCGDFNFTPGSAPYQLFTTSTLPQRHQSYPRPPGETAHQNMCRMNTWIDAVR